MQCPICVYKNNGERSLFNEFKDLFGYDNLHQLEHSNDYYLSESLQAHIFSIHSQYDIVDYIVNSAEKNKEVDIVDPTVMGLRVDVNDTDKARIARNRLLRKRKFNKIKRLIMKGKSKKWLMKELKKIHATDTEVNNVKYGIEIAKRCRGIRKQRQRKSKQRNIIKARRLKEDRIEYALCVKNMKYKDIQKRLHCSSHTIKKVADRIKAKEKQQLDFYNTVRAT